MSYVYNMFCPDSVHTRHPLQPAHFYSRVWVLKVVCCTCTYRSDNLRTTLEAFLWNLIVENSAKTVKPSKFSFRLNSCNDHYFKTYLCLYLLLGYNIVNIYESVKYFEHKL
jgi:hypothetical protein